MFASKLQPLPDFLFRHHVSDLHFSRTYVKFAGLCSEKQTHVFMLVKPLLTLPSCRPKIDRLTSKASSGGTWSNTSPPRRLLLYVHKLHQKAVLLFHSHAR